MIHLLTALPCEARPLIKHYRLRPVTPDSPLRLHANEHLRLAITGVGRDNMAAAVGYLQASGIPREQAAWLNIGVAGHAHKPLGSLGLVHKAQDDRGSPCFYPPLLFHNAPEGAELLTSHTPVNDYPDPHWYDMEGYAFFSQASRFTILELVHALKIVSDNRLNHSEHVSAALVEELVAAQLQAIDEVLRQLAELQQSHADITREPAGLQRCLQQWHFSHYRKKQLQGLLYRLQAMDEEIPWTKLEGKKSAAEVLATLERHLDQVNIVFPTPRSMP